MLCSGVARAQEVWTITTADFQQRRSAVFAIDANGIESRDPAGEARRIAWKDLLEISRGTEPAAVSQEVLVLHLVGGDRLIGAPSKLADEMLTWATPLGEFAIPLQSARAITRGEGAMVDAPPRDQVLLGNGDTVEGVIDSMDENAVTINTTEPQPISWDLVSAVRFAGASSSEKPTGPTFRIALAGGSVLGAKQIETVESQLQIRTTDDTSRSVPLASVLSIEQRGGPVTWLTDLAPTETIQRPYFGADAAPIQLNKSASGAPLRDGERTARGGFGVTSYCKQTWKLSGEYTAFRTKFAMEGALPYANVTVRVLLDDRVAYEVADVTAATASQLVMLPLGNAKSLSLEVDYGKTYDVQDRLNWIEPALLREVPATQPAR